jgi:lipid-A-disaccharide synthase
MLSIMLSIVKSFPDYQFVIAGAPSQDAEFYNSFIANESVHFVANCTYDLLSISHAAMVTSGTATLETALFKVPEVVCYKTSWISYQIGKRLVKLKFISLVNLILNKEVVTELIQGEFNSERLTKELTAILQGPVREAQFEAYYDLEVKLGGSGASLKVAELIYNSLN